MAGRHHGEYTIGWICALSVEMAAAITMLDEKHPDLPTSQGDHNSYVLGRVRSHNVVIACLPSGIYGTASAATVAATMRLTFPSIQVGLMVGIGGGVPSRQSDVRLGDVVVGRPTRDSGGVIQHDFEKTPCPDYRRQHQLQQNGISQILSGLAAKYPEVGINLEHPGENQDRFFVSNYDHPEAEDTCNCCDSTKLIARPRQNSKDPRIWYGLIASANQVMKHGVARNRLAKQYGFLCYEMEAAGLVNHFPCVVIRGICDYADPHKNKQWQSYDTMTTTAYMKELLGTMSSRCTFRDCTPQTIITRRVVNTTKWFIDHPDLRAWLLERSVSSLWCTGKVRLPASSW
ncbi:nucleoside phosphorylase domain-containing protein [Aspergillus pseudodeflectus]|uniref:Nucleoside phosphorylase domain-containing protein n=1 Tax=Aspergillus pseudodeflectus TaxID=176178 RepID=A0ABR4L1E6_9EURO